MNTDLDLPSNAITDINELLRYRGQTIYCVRHAANSSTFEVAPIVVGPVFYETDTRENRFVQCFSGIVHDEKPRRYYVLDTTLLGEGVYRASRIDFYGFGCDPLGLSAIFPDRAAADAWAIMVKFTHGELPQNPDTFWRFRWGLTMSEAAVNSLFNFDF